MVIAMNLTRALAHAFGIREAETPATPAGVVPPPRGTAGPVSPTQATTVAATHRALQVLATSAMQLSLDVERSGQVLEGAEVPALVRRPNLDMTRSEFVETLVLALAGYGNAYIFREGGPTLTETTQLTPIAPYLVTPWKDDAGNVHYDYDGRTYGPDRIRHLKYLAMPGQLLGVGPIQAAQQAMTSARDMRDYSAQWWQHGQPAGILSTSKNLTDEELARYRDAWNLVDKNGQPLPAVNNPSRVRVIAGDLEYTPLLISPKDSLWLEAQAFDTLEIARIFGMPTSLMLTAPEGSSMTYQNVEQEWLAFVKFTLMAYLRKIEDALTEMTPRGQTVRFNLETLLRSDTTTRYAAHATGIAAGFLTVDEVRRIENRPPLDPTTAPAKDETNEHATPQS
ncbi:phage portal protein [Schaalia sp. ZJ1691]|uniref:phage portal protein n=1 Tax=Schaalia sp. ZJ1691 TaxID=2709404 RepID=UPI0013EC1F00|nr:phage portal protein [Schaalia sp. ZJ1691]